MATIRIRAARLRAITEADRNNPVRIKIDPSCDGKPCVNSSFKVASQCIIPLVERARVLWTHGEGEERGRYRSVKQSAAVGRLGAPAIDCLIIGDRRCNVLRNFGRAKGNIEAIEYFVFNCGIGTYCAESRKSRGYKPNRLYTINSPRQNIRFGIRRAARNKEGDVD